MSAELAVVGVLALAVLGLGNAWGAGVRAGRRLASTSSITARAVVTATVILAVQWAVLTHTTDAGVWAGVLGVPALVTGVTVARLFTVSTAVRSRSARGEW